MDAADERERGGGEVQGGEVLSARPIASTAGRRRCQDAGDLLGEHGDRHVAAGLRLAARAARPVSSAWPTAEKVAMPERRDAACRRSPAAARHAKAETAHPSREQEAPMRISGLRRPQPVAQPSAAESARAVAVTMLRLEVSASTRRHRRRAREALGEEEHGEAGGEREPEEEDESPHPVPREIGDRPRTNA